MILQHDRYVGTFGPDNLLEEGQEEEEEEEHHQKRSSVCSYIIPIEHEQTHEKHVLFNHIQICVDPENPEKVTKVNLMYVPLGHAIIEETQAMPFAVQPAPLQQPMEYSMIDMLDMDNHGMNLGARKRQREEKETQQEGEKEMSNGEGEGATDERDEEEGGKEGRDTKKMKLVYPK